jgi:integrase
MSENAIGYLLNRAGYHSRHVPHGWRATFSSVMNEANRNDRQVIDLMLAHAPDDKTEAAYNRALHMARRRELAQEWANLLLEGSADLDDVVAGRRR